MAIKQRKQVTGTTAQINAYAGVEGQLVWDKTKKKWVGMSGTAGTNYPMASERHQHSVANVTGLQDALNGKLATTAKIPYSQITGTPSIPDVSGLIPKTGDRGAIAGYESVTLGTFVGDSSADSQASEDDIIVQNGTTGKAWTKVVYMLSGSVTLNTSWKWAGGKAPALKFPGVLVCHWNNTGGIASYTAGAS